MWNAGAPFRHAPPPVDYAGQPRRRRVCMCVWSWQIQRYTLLWHSCLRQLCTVIWDFETLCGFHLLADPRRADNCLLSSRLNGDQHIQRLHSRTLLSYIVCKSKATENREMCESGRLLCNDNLSDDCSALLCGMRLAKHGCNYSVW